MKAVITIGVSGSGKTTWAEQFVRNRGDWVNINRDDFRFAGGNRDYYNYKFKKSKENEITRKVWQTIEGCARVGWNVIISDTNLNVARRTELVNELENLGFEVEYKYFDIPLQEAVRRDNQREGGVGQSVIMRQWLQYQQQVNPDQQYKPVIGAPYAYVFDIDGTVAKMVSRGPFDWDKVDTDDVIDQVMSVAVALANDGYDIIFLSGRDGSCRELTESWLYENFVGNANAGVKYHLYMREEGSMVRDSVVKEELFNDFVAPYWHVLGVFDDRPQVIKETWLTLGVPVFAVGNPYIDF